VIICFQKIAKYVASGYVDDVLRRRRCGSTTKWGTPLTTASTSPSSQNHWRRPGRKISPPFCPCSGTTTDIDKSPVLRTSVTFSDTVSKIHHQAGSAVQFKLMTFFDNCTEDSLTMPQTKHVLLAFFDKFGIRATNKDSDVLKEKAAALIWAYHHQESSD
jgi:hypothetical protein